MRSCAFFYRESIATRTYSDLLSLRCGSGFRIFFDFHWCCGGLLSRWVLFFGIFFSCPNSGFNLFFLNLGGVLVYVAYPITKTLGDGSLFWEKKISGISLVLSGSIVSFLSSVALFFFGPVFGCLYYGCPSIFSLTYVDYWIDIFCGLTLLLVGLILLFLDSRKKEGPIHDNPIRIQDFESGVSSILMPKIIVK